MPKFPFEIVGFDLDGTLLDTHVDLGLALNHALAQVGRDPVPVTAVASLIGGGSRLMLNRALEITGGPCDMPMDQLYRHLLDYYEANIAVHTRLYPGGAEMLDALESRGVKLAVVTNKMEYLAVRLLDALDLSQRLFTIIGGDTMGPGRAKPAPDPLLEMIRRAPAKGQAAPRAAYVGDTTFDTGAARAAGLPCVAVSFGFCDAPPNELGADAVIDHYDQLVPTLQRM